MPKIDNVKRILVDQFPSEDRQTVSQLANILNYFMEQVTNTLNGNVDYSNLKNNILELTLNVDSLGKPLINNKFGSDMGLIGMTVIRVDNLTNAAVYPTSTPFITFTSTGDGFYTISNITGLLPNNKYRLVIELIRK